MIYTFYLISHPDYPELIYIGSTCNFKERKRAHKSHCYNEKSNQYNKKLYQFIRTNEILFDELVFEVLDEFECENRETARKFEQIYIDQFEINLNEIRAYTDIKEWRKRYKELNKEIIKDKSKKYKKEYYENNK